jgi:hypothetical protein
MSEGARESAIREFSDDRGRLRVFEGEQDLPFPIRRCFVISDVPEGKTRARHVVASEQYLVALAGSCTALTKAGNIEQRYVLQDGNRGLHVPRGTWLLLENFSRGTVIMVLSSENYVAPAAARPGH